MSAIHSHPFFPETIYSSEIKPPLQIKTIENFALFLKLHAAEKTPDLLGQTTVAIGRGMVCKTINLTIDSKKVIINLYQRFSNYEISSSDEIVNISLNSNQQYTIPISYFSEAKLKLAFELQGVKV